MTKDSLSEAMAAIAAAWGPLSSGLVQTTRRHLEALVRAPIEEPWLAALQRDRPASRELHRDPVHGFVLQAHVEPPDLYRPPHDHGRGWVIYAVQQGASRMGTYARVRDAAGRDMLVRRGNTLVGPGRAEVYLPGDIHDTLCVAGPALLLRFTDRDLRKEDHEQRRVTRYVEREGVWAPAVPGP